LASGNLSTAFLLSGTRISLRGGCRSVEERSRRGKNANRRGPSASGPSSTTPRRLRLDGAAGEVASCAGGDDGCRGPDRRAAVLPLRGHVEALGGGDHR